MNDASALSTPCSTGRAAESTNSASWLLLGGVLLGILALQARSALWIEPASLTTLCIATIALGGAAWFYGTMRLRPNFRAMCLSLMQVLLFSALGSILSYLLAREGGALMDEQLAAWDRAMGLDWLTFITWVDRHGWMVLPLRLAYASLIPQIILLVITFGFTGHIKQMRMMIFAAILSGTIAILISPLVPALSNYVHLGLKPGDFGTINPYAGYIHLHDYLALRNGTMTSMSLATAQGIITFPSYHAALATVTLWSFWRAPYLRWPGTLLALLTIIATPVDGGHYFIDVLAGCAIAGFAIMVAHRAIRWNPALPKGNDAQTASPA